MVGFRKPAQSLGNGHCVAGACHLPPGFDLKFFPPLIRVNWGYSRAILPFILPPPLPIVPIFSCVELYKLCLICIVRKVRLE